MKVSSSRKDSYLLPYSNFHYEGRKAIQFCYLFAFSFCFLFHFHLAIYWVLYTKKDIKVVPKFTCKEICVNNKKKLNSPKETNKQVYKQKYYFSEKEKSSMWKLLKLVKLNSSWVMGKNNFHNEFLTFQLHQASNIIEYSSLISVKLFSSSSLSNRPFFLFSS